MQEIAPDDPKSLKGTEQQWKERVAKYPSLKKLDDQGRDFKESHDGREERLHHFIKNHKDLQSMKNNPKRILEVMDNFAADQEFMIHVGPAKAEILQNLLIENKPRVLVELGGYCGYSAILFGEQLRVMAANRTVHVWSIEENEQFATIARDLVSLAGLQDYVDVVTGAANETLKKLSRDEKIDRIDFLFLDHAEGSYERDIKLAMDDLKLLNENAVIVADNCLRPGAPEYKQYIQNRQGLRTRLLKALIMPGEFEDEFCISTVLPQNPNQETEDERRGVGMGVI